MEGGGIVKHRTRVHSVCKEVSLAQIYLGCLADDPDQRETRCLHQSPAAHSPPVYLEVLPNSLLVDALGQGHLGWGPPAPCSNGTGHWVLQGNWAVLAQPGREAEVRCVRGCMSILHGTAGWVPSSETPPDFPLAVSTSVFASFGQSKEGGPERGRQKGTLRYLLIFYTFLRNSVKDWRSQEDKIFVPTKTR